MREQNKRQLEKKKKRSVVARSLERHEKGRDEKRNFGAVKLFCIIL